MSRTFGWLAPLSEAERAAVVYSEPGELLADGDHYLDATSPKRGVVLSMDGEKVPVGGVYIRQSNTAADLWTRLQQAGLGKL